ncbi:MAG: NAD(P)/FAD-dependent oxidoreductase [Candidatus Saccharicenans sp.]|nr:NAD(P)/FAD-dependent oxidoreductase [Candidatus Saccharicenans sp.]
MPESKRVLVIGAGPAGLTAAYELVKSDYEVTVLEKDSQVGGISRTVNYRGYLFDLGGHRFFTKYPGVKKIWEEVLPGDFLIRPRLSRIYYRGKFFYYPLRPFNAFWNLGPFTSTLALLSYLKARIKPYPDPENFEQWVVNQFGRKLYEIFFKTYTEKVWGIPCTRISADWAAQRIKGLSLGKAVLNAFGLKGKETVRTLTDQFHYPRRGPGQFWEKMAEIIVRGGGRLILRAEAVEIIRRPEGNFSVKIKTINSTEEMEADIVISSMPLSELILSLRPFPPDEVIKAARSLTYRDFYTAGIIINKERIFPDNWIYIHSPEIRAGRLQNFKNWSPELVPDPEKTMLGLEYFCFSTDPVWSLPDKELIQIAADDLERLRFARKEEIVDGSIVRIRGAYPVYSPGYKKNIGIIKEFLDSIKNLQTIGRNGLHRYNNQDHSMMSAIYAVRKLHGQSCSPWDINAEDEYHEVEYHQR